MKTKSEENNIRFTALVQLVSTNGISDGFLGLNPWFIHQRVNKKGFWSSKQIPPFSRWLWAAFAVPIVLQILRNFVYHILDLSAWHDMIWTAVKLLHYLESVTSEGSMISSASPLWPSYQISLFQINIKTHIFTWPFYFLAAISSHTLSIRRAQCECPQTWAGRSSYA